jgi:protein SCO1/2
MSRNFAAIQQQLAADPQLYNKTHLLSVSFDPEHDTPKVLRSYGNTYTVDPAARLFLTGILPLRRLRNWMRWTSSLTSA